MANTFLLIIFCGLLACSACGEEITYEDIVSFIQDLYPDLIQTKADILETNLTIGSNVWDHVPNYLDDVYAEYYRIYLDGMLTQRMHECLMTSSQKILDSEILVDYEFNKECNYEGFSNMLQLNYDSLTAVQDSAKNIVNDFIKANMWCSNNGDLHSCYSQVHDRFIKRGSAVSSAIELAKEALATVEVSYELISESCTAKALAKSTGLEMMVMKMMLACLEKKIDIP